jgi:hypothetical protein
MAIPTFSGSSIIDVGGHEIWGDRDTKYFTGSMPGVNGIYLQKDGFGGQAFTLMGFLSGSSHSAATGRYADISVQENDVGTYVGTDGTSTYNVLLRSVRQIGRVLPQVDGSYLIPVRLEFVWLAPS